MNGFSTRSYEQVIPEMAESVGVSKSSVSRETIEASEAALKDLLERSLEDKDFIVIYIDGLHCGEHCVIGAVGVDLEGHKQVLGIHEGATENGAACKDLLQNLVERGLDPDNACSSSTARRLCVARSTRCSERKRRCKDAVFIKCATW